MIDEDNRPDIPATERLVVEPATNDDVDALADAWLDLAREQLAYGSHVVPGANHSTIRDLFATHVFNDGLLVARIDGDVVGFASYALERGTFTLDTRRGLLSNIYVVPEARNRGVGTALLETVEDALAERGATVVMLEAMASNEGARRFYRRHGYETYRVGMERTLTSKSPAENDTHSKEDGQ
ncbi:GNAT family N-acetyltransferase [Natronobiforma cellulositropha]|uniref:GNAT family N-acetyltransferase n=1 Tax=Natronobiforma cellulositropha TaxID=1679076 RepID=UPI0021D60644|nr:GNAT family N-acetyltransferase [Natronobiforma cellulositropha]